MKELRNSFRWKSPPYATHTARKIPEGSTVRRRLFADDGPAESSGNPNMINSADDVNRMIQEDLARAARRWRFDVQSEEPIPNDTLSWMPSLDQDVEEIVECVRNKRRERLNEPDISYIASLGRLDNISNTVMDSTQEYYHEGVQHWNFDFDNKIPAAGAVAWQQVGSHWVGNKPGSCTNLVLYPTETENGVKTSISHEELTNGKADKSVLKPTDKIEHLLTENVNAMYGDWKRELKIGVKAALIITARREFDREVLHDMTLLQQTNQYHQITKSEAIAMIRNEDINDDDNNSEDYNSEDVKHDTDICEDNNSTPKKSSSLLGFARKE